MPAGWRDVAWELREQCDTSATPPDRAIAEALARPDPRPVVLLDVGDNVGAGTPGDATVLLEALIRNRVPSFLVSLFDPAAVRLTAAAGVGAHVELEVGGNTDRLHGDPGPDHGQRPLGGGEPVGGPARQRRLGRLRRRPQHASSTSTAAALCCS